jgi:hypothetical protein
MAASSTSKRPLSSVQSSMVRPWSDPWRLHSGKRTVEAPVECGARARHPDRAWGRSHECGKPARGRFRRARATDSAFRVTCSSPAAS